MTIKDELNTENCKDIFCKLYGAENVEKERNRYMDILNEFEKNYGSFEDAFFFSSPGRSEIIGNHTDHNLGKIIGASIDMDCVGVAKKNNTSQVRITSVSFQSNSVIDLDDLEPFKYSGTNDLIRGIIKGMLLNGHKCEGFDLCLTSSVVASSGVSSSASFEMLVCEVINYLFNDDKLSTLEMAKCGQYSENVYWKKASGLLDQMACGYGGMITIDFKDPNKPLIRKLNDKSLTDNYDFLIVSTGENHADLSAEYSSMPIEMKKVANYFGKAVLRECSLDQVLLHTRELRNEVGDRAILRAFHYFTENNRVDKMVKFLDENNFEMALECIKESGNSSWKYLQNCANNEKPSEQGITLSLMLTENYLNKLGSGVCRVHGGGFAGVILVVLPKGKKQEYKEYIKQYQDYPIFDILIRPYGSVNISKLIEDK